ncbi:MAG: FAD-dependent oxidoreductase, partial [Thermoguttaceae bacterium]
MARLNWSLWVAGLLLVEGAAGGATVGESARQIPVAAEVDVVVVGGTVGAVAAAAEAADRGAKVMLVAPRHYLGEDVCGTLRLWLEEGEIPRGRLTKAMFAGGRTTTPLKVKQLLERRLLDGGAEFLLGSYATDVLVDGGGRPAGIVMANRAGRQAVVAKVIVDATRSGIVARMAGAELLATTEPLSKVRRVVLGGEDSSAVRPSRSIPAGIQMKGTELFYHEYVVEAGLGDGGFGALAKADRQVRDTTYREGQLRAGEQWDFVPPRTVACGRKDDGAGRQGRQPERATAAKDTTIAEGGAEAEELTRLRPRGVDRMFVLGLAAGGGDRSAWGVDDSESTGRLVGAEAAAEAASLVPAADIVVGSGIERPEGSGDVREILRGLRATDGAEKTVPSPARGVPVLAEVDVVVVGGGTSGACAAIGAARRGAKV